MRSATALFDFAVNAPAVEARRALQRVVGAYADGALGPKSMALLAAAIANRGERRVALDLIDRRLKRYVRRVQSGLSSSDFLLGWLRRLHHLIVELYEGGERP